MDCELSQPDPSEIFLNLTCERGTLLYPKLMRHRCSSNRSMSTTALVTATLSTSINCITQICRQVQADRRNWGVGDVSPTRSVVDFQYALFSGEWRESVCS